MKPIFEAMLNGWWQGIVLTALVWVVMRELPRISAATKVAIWQITLLVVLLLPAIQRIPNPSTPPPQTPPTPRTAMPASITPARSAGTMPPIQQAASRTNSSIELSGQDLPQILLLTAAALALFQLFRLALGYLAVRRLKLKALPANLAIPAPPRRTIDVLTSERIGMPMAIGYLRPAILLPRHLPQTLTPEEMNYVLLHEAAHLRRKDDWVALAERLVRAVFCFQPAVHFIARQIEREREIACDDWVVQQSGAAKPYASALTRLAAIASAGRVPILASGSGRRKQIFARLETLFDRTRNRMPSISEPMVLAAGLVILFAVSQGARFNHLFAFSNYSSRWVESDGSRRLEFNLRGDIDFTSNDQDVATMSPGSALVVEQSEGWRTRRAEFHADSHGEIDRRYFTDNASRPFDAEARRFLAAVLPTWIREQGKNVPTRAARLLHEKGVDGALDEVRGIRSGGVKRRYLEELYSQATLDAVQSRRAWKIAGGIDSDGERAQFLENVYDPSRDSGAQVFDFIDTMHSSGDRARVLIRVIGREPASPRLMRSIARIDSDGDKTNVLLSAVETSKAALPAAFFDAASTIHGDGDRARLLTAVLENHDAGPDNVASVLASAAAMNSDGDKAKVLIAAASALHGAAQPLHQAAQVLASIHSDGDRRHCLEALLREDGRNADTLHQVLLLAAQINSDGDKSEILTQAAAISVDPEPVRTAFFAAAGAIHSSSDQRRVLMAVLARQDLQPETLGALALLATRIASRDDQAAIIKALAARQTY